MAAAYSLELYTCEVCLENMLNKNPRLLSCHHSFCTDCLKKIMKEGTILCPTCRRKTIVKNNDTSNLDINFTLVKVKEHMDKVFSSKTLICHLCLSQNATLKCQECVQLLCEDCRDKHNTIKKFKDHKMYQLCEKHREGMITHICTQCAQAACAKCVITEHSDHEDHVQTYEEGIDELTKTMKEYENKLDEHIKSGVQWGKEHKKKLYDVAEGIRQVEGIKQYYYQKAKEAEKTLKKLRESMTEGEQVETNFGMKVQEWKNKKASLQKRLEEIKEGFLDNVIAVKNETEKLLSDNKDKLNYATPDINVEDPRTGKVVNFQKEDVYLNDPIMIKEISCPFNETWGQPWNISYMDNDCVLICDWDKPYITCAYSSDKPTTTIPAAHGNVKDACVYKDHLYTAYNSSITRRTFKDGIAGSEVILVPKIKDINSLVVVNDTSVYLLNQSEKTIFKFNPKNGSTKALVTTSDAPYHLSVVRRDQVLLLVSFYSQHLINVYDDAGRLLFKFGSQGSADGQLHYPFGTTCTSEGILVADQSNNRISQFSFDGEFTRHILTRKDRPIGLYFNSPYLWVSESASPRTVKCFKIYQ